MQTLALDRYRFPALVNVCDDATVGQFRGQRCNEYGEKAGDIRLFQMVYTEVHEVKVRGVDDADAEDNADVAPPVPEPKELATAPALAPRGLESQISASAAAKAKTAQSKEQVTAADPSSKLHDGHPLQADGAEVLTAEELVEALKGRLGGGVVAVDTHAKEPPPPKNPVKPSKASKAKNAKATKATKAAKAARAEAAKAAKVAKAAKPAKAAKAAKTTKASRAKGDKATPTRTMFSSDLGDLVHGGVKEGLFKGHDCEYMYIDDDTGETVAYKAKLGINASGFASQKVEGSDNRVMGRDWVKCRFYADQTTVWRLFARGKLNSQAEGGWSICETRKDWGTILARLKKHGVPNKAVEAHFKDTKKTAKRARDS